MINLHDIRYARLGTQDLDGAIKFATTVVGLQLVAREANAAYFRSDKADVRGDTRDHTLVYFEGDPADQTIGLELHRSGRPGCGRRSVGAGGAAGACRHARGMRQPAHPGLYRVIRPQRQQDRDRRSPVQQWRKFFPGRQVGITNFSHVALFSTDTKRDTEFWTRLVNARVSDWLGEATFLRIGTVHHSVVLMPSSKPGIQHINHQVEDIDDVMQSYYWLKQQGVKIVYGPGRHPISTAMMVYFEGPDGMVYEYSVGVKHIMPEQEATYRPRQFSLEGYNGDMWGSYTETPGLPRETAAGAKIRLVV